MQIGMIENKPKRELLGIKEVCTIKIIGSSYHSGAYVRSEAFRAGFSYPREIIGSVWKFFQLSMQNPQKVCNIN